jgi:ABC-type antimicrobial peptide transport system permease subunit
VVSLSIAVTLVVTLVGLTQTASAQVSGRFDARRNREVTATDPAPRNAAPALTTTAADELEARARRVAGVDGVAVLVSGFNPPAAASLSRTSVPLETFGATPALFETVGAEVSWPDGQAPMIRGREAVVGDLAAGQLGLATPEDRPTVFVNGQAFAVVGVLTDVDRLINLRSAVIVGIDDLSLIAPPGPLSVVVNTASGAALQVAVQLAVALDPVRPERFEIEAPPDPKGLRGEVETDLQNTMLLLGAFAFATAIAMTAVAMSSSIRERTGEFGLRRAVGAQPRHIRQQVASEALMLGLMSAIVGLVVGLGIVAGVTVFRHWQPVLDWRAVPLALGASLVASMLGGLSAAWRAGRIQPSEALRR